MSSGDGCGHTRILIRRSHHDYIGFHLEREQGVRIITVFLYLNDVEEGIVASFDPLVGPSQSKSLFYQAEEQTFLNWIW